MIDLGIGFLRNDVAGCRPDNDDIDGLRALDVGQGIKRLNDVVRVSRIARPPSLRPRAGMGGDAAYENIEARTTALAYGDDFPPSRGRAL